MWNVRREQDEDTKLSEKVMLRITLNKIAGARYLDASWNYDIETAKKLINSQLKTRCIEQNLNPTVLLIPTTRVDRKQIAYARNGIIHYFLVAALLEIEFEIQSIRQSMDKTLLKQEGVFLPI